MKPPSSLSSVFLAAAGLLVGSVVLMYWVGLGTIASYQHVSAQRAILRHLQETVATLSDAETGQRGYLLTGEEQYLEPYHRALARVQSEREALHKLVTAGELPESGVEAVDGLITAKLAELEQTVQLRRTNGLAAALAVVRAGHGKEVMDQFRSQVAALFAAEENALQAALARARAAVVVRTGAYVLVIGFNLGVLLWAYRRIKREVQGREAAVQETIRQKELLATTLASIGDGVITTDAQGRVTFLNAEAERLTGWGRQEAIGQALPAVFRIADEQTRRPAENPVEKVLRTGKVVGLANHTILIARNGTEWPIDDSAAPIRMPDGSLSGVVLVFRDFTQQRMTQQATARLAAIVEFSGDAILTKNLGGIVQTWNAAAERLFGYKAEEVVGKPITVLFPPGRLEEEALILERLRKGQPVARLETIRLGKDGRQFPVSVSVSPVRDAEGAVIGASTTIHDITDLVAAREALVREKELLATTLASIGDAVVVTNAEGRITFLNAEAERLTGWRNAEAAGQPLRAVFRIINEESRRPVEDPVEKVLRLGHVVGLANHTILLARDGREVPIDDSAAPIRQGGGALFGVVLVFRDFTEHKQQEAQLAQAVVARTAKLREVVSELQHVSYAMVHDMRAPLRAMQAFARILAAEPERETPEQRQNYLEHIMTAASRLDKLIHDALNYNRVILEELPMQPVALEPLLRGILETYPNLAAVNGDIRVEAGLPTVRGNEALLTQCFSNLLGNAVKFVAPGVRPRVVIRSEASNGTARIWIEDNGIGIPQMAHKRLFGMFQKLDSEYEGTGIGLAIVRKVVERMGGKVGAESEPGRGSRFWVELPVEAAASPQCQAA